MRTWVSIAFAAAAAAGVALASEPTTNAFTGSFVLSALSSGNNTVELLPAEPLFGTDSDSLAMALRPRFAPVLVLTVADGAVLAATVRLGDFAFAHPKSVLTVAAGAAEVAHTITPDATDSEAALPAGVVEAIAASSLEATVTLAVPEERVTSYTYALPDGLPADLVASGQKYDLTPRNTSMLSKFMVQLPEGRDQLSVWVTRKPPMPNFLLMVQVGGKPLAHVNVRSGTASSDAIGFDMPLAGDDLARLKAGPVALAVHFLEPVRSVVARGTIRNLRATLDSLVEENGGADTDAAETIATTVDGLKLRLVYHAKTRLMGVQLLQAGPMKNLLLSLYREDRATGARVLLMRESDHVVPHYPAAAEGAQQYGWYDALPINKTLMTVDGVDTLDTAVFVEVAYDVATAAEVAPGQALAAWLKDYGGDASLVELGYLSTPQHSFQRKHALAVTQDVPRGDNVVLVSYSTFFPIDFAQRGAFAHALESHLDEHAKHVAAHAIHPDARRIMLLSTAILLGLYEETTNFRLFFNTFAASAHKTAAFFSDAEIALFAFDPEVALEVGRAKALWGVEYDVLAKAGDFLPRRFGKDEYLAVRSQIETRLFNISGNLVLTPVVDLLTHDDDANCELKFHDQVNKLTITAVRNITAGDALTFDFGVKSKSKADFLLQFGAVPPNAADVVIVNVGGNKYRLTLEKASFAFIAEAMAAESHAESAAADGDDDDEPGRATPNERAVAARALAELIRAKFDALPAKLPTAGSGTKRVAAMAERLLRSQREVLSRHLTYIAENERDA